MSSTGDRIAGRAINATDGTIPASTARSVAIPHWPVDNCCSVILAREISNGFMGVCHLNPSSNPPAVSWDNLPETLMAAEFRSLGESDTFIRDHTVRALDGPGIGKSSNLILAIQAT